LIHEEPGRWKAPTGNRGRGKEAREGRGDIRDERKAAPNRRNGSTMVEEIRQFFKEFRIEMKKVSWPTRKEIVASTGVVLVVVLIVSFYLGAADLLFSKLLKLMLS
jgi:preprotein translocase subunit SecE